MTDSRTLRRQLITWLAGPLLILWVVSTAVHYDIAKRFVNLAYDRELLEAAQDIGRQIRGTGDRITVDLPEVALQILQSRESGRLYYRVTGPGTEHVIGERDLPELPDVPADETPNRVQYYDDVFRDQVIRAVALRVPVQPGSGRGAALIQVAEHVTVRDEFARQVILRMILPQAMLILLAALAVWHAVGRALRPLASLQRELATRSHRDLSPLPEQQVPEEVRPLIRAMNDLLDRLSKVLVSRQRFIADAAHQLRTPVAGLKTQTELALRQLQPGDAPAMLKQLQNATEQLTRLINQLLSLARAEPGAGRTHQLQPLDLAALARETTTDWVPSALNRQIDLGYDGASAARIEGDPFLLKEMLGNMLDNAIRYTPRGGQVTVRVAAGADTVTLSVEDNGPGIPSSERERVFERFYRILGTGADGCGLGLAIVREIALSHSAEASLSSGASGAGTLVCVAFPLAARWGVNRDS